MIGEAWRVAVLIILASLLVFTVHSINAGMRGVVLLLLAGGLLWEAFLRAMDACSDEEGEE